MRQRIFKAAEKLRTENYRALDEIAEKLEWLAERGDIATVEALADILR